MGSIPNAHNVIPKTDKWILPAPRTSDLRQKQQYGIHSSYEEHLTKKTDLESCRRLFHHDAPSLSVLLLVAASFVSSACPN
jgi:hypothetical protein